MPIIKIVADQYKLKPPLEIAGPIEAPPINSNPWIICGRSPATPRTTYATEAFRISTIADGCDGAAYRPAPD